MELVDILAKCYKRYDPSIVDGDCVKNLYQRRFDDDIGKKYYITIKDWDFTRYGNPLIQYEATAQLYIGEDRDPIDLSFSGNLDLDDVEKMVEKFWRDNNCEYYEKWNNS